MKAMIGANLHQYRRAANYFGTAQVCPRNNALLAEPTAVHPPEVRRIACVAIVPVFASPDATQTISGPALDEIDRCALHCACRVRTTDPALAATEVPVILHRTPTSRRAFIVNAFAASIALSIALGAQSVLGEEATQLDITGLYNTTSSGDSLVTMPLRLQQSGTTVIGSYGQTGHFAGRLRNRVLSATWRDSRGTGWLTFTFALDRSFGGEWGYAGRRPSGQIIGLPVVMPAAWKSAP